MTCRYPDLGGVSDWPKQVSLAVRPIGRTVTRHQYGISALLPQTLLRGQTSGGVAKHRLQWRDYTKKNIKLLFAGKSMPRERKPHSPSVHQTTQRLRMDYDTIRFLTGIKEKQDISQGVQWASKIGEFSVFSAEFSGPDAWNLKEVWAPRVLVAEASQTIYFHAHCRESVQKVFQSQPDTVALSVIACCTSTKPQTLKNLTLKSRITTVALRRADCCLRNRKLQTTNKRTSCGIQCTYSYKFLLYVHVERLFYILRLFSPIMALLFKVSPSLL